LTTDELSNIEQIFIQQTVAGAKKLSEILFDKDKDKIPISLLNNFLPGISHFYHYSPEIRATIGTTNLIEYIAINVRILLKDQNFNNMEYARRYNNIASRRILETGKSFIPAWDVITQPVNAL
jgi:transposase-like protein